jgi:hypothetical protein
MLKTNEINGLLTFALLNLDPRINDKRFAINSLLVEVALYLTNSACDLQKIITEIEKIVSQRNFISSEDCQRAIDDCVEKDVIKIYDRNKYILKPNRKQKLAKVFNSTELLKSTIKENIIIFIEIEIGESLPIQLGEKVFIEVQKFLSNDIYKSSIKLARENITLDEIVIEFENSELLHQFENKISQFVDEERVLLKKKILGGITKYFRSMPEELKSLLEIIHHNVLISQIINIDPSLVNTQMDLYSQRRLYLDTNVVLAFIFSAQSSHKVVKEIIDASLKLGTQLLISPVTCEELENQVKRAKRSKLESERKSIINRLGIYGDDAIFATYKSKKNKQPSLDWDSYISPFEKLDELLIQHNILVEKEGFEEATNIENLDKIKKIIRENKPPYAKNPAIDHDAINCSLINILRNKYPADERGQIVWLLTIDSSLKSTQKVLFGAKMISHPFCIQVANWGEVVLPAQNIKDFVFSDFITYLTQFKLGALADSEIIQLDFLETIIDSSIDVDNLLECNTEQVRRAISKLQVNREARNLLEEKEKDSSEISIENQLAFKDILNKTIEENNPFQLKQVALQKENDLLKEKIKNREEELNSISSRLDSIESLLFFKIRKFLNKVFR